MPKQPLQASANHSIRVVPYQDGVAYIVQDRATLTGVMVPVPHKEALQLARDTVDLVGRQRAQRSGGID